MFIKPVFDFTLNFLFGCPNSMSPKSVQPITNRPKIPVVLLLHNITFIRIGDKHYKTTELVQKILALRGKAVKDSDISNLCDQISKLNETITQMHSTNKKIISELTVVKYKKGASSI